MLSNANFGKLDVACGILVRFLPAGSPIFFTLSLSFFVNSSIAAFVFKSLAVCAMLTVCLRQALDLEVLRDRKYIPLNNLQGFLDKYKFFLVRSLLLGPLAGMLIILLKLANPLEALLIVILAYSQAIVGILSNSFRGMGAPLLGATLEPGSAYFLAMVIASVVYAVFPRLLILNIISLLILFLLAISSIILVFFQLLIAKFVIMNCEHVSQLPSFDPGPIFTKKQVNSNLQNQLVTILGALIPVLALSTISSSATVVYVNSEKAANFLNFFKSSIDLLYMPKFSQCMDMKTGLRHLRLQWLRAQKESKMLALASLPLALVFALAYSYSSYTNQYHDSLIYVKFSIMSLFIISSSYSLWCGPSGFLLIVWGGASTLKNIYASAEIISAFLFLILVLLRMPYVALVIYPIVRILRDGHVYRRVSKCFYSGNLRFFAS